MMGKQSELIAAVRGIYDRIDAEILSQSKVGENCRACGDCCDFDRFDHRLFLTTPEMVYFQAKVGRENLRQMVGGVCPWREAGKCGVYEHRFAGCRIFCCKGDAEFQGRLSEWAVGEFKGLCEKFGLEYRYNHLAATLAEFGD